MRRYCDKNPNAADDHERTLNCLMSIELPNFDGLTQNSKIPNYTSKVAKLLATQYLAKTFATIG